MPFHYSNDPEVVNDFVEKLEYNGIDFTIEKTAQVLDSTIIGVSSTDDIVIKLKPEDFTRAHQCLEDFYKTEVDRIDETYYLYTFSNDELYEIISKPDEWGYLDYLLAQKILIERGKKIDPAILESLKKERKKELAKPEKAALSSYIVAYFFIVAGLFSLLSPVFYYSDFSYLLTVISFFIGRNIYTTKKTLPDGQSVFSYSEANRRRGRTLMNLALVVFIFCAIKQLIAVSQSQF